MKNLWNHFKKFLFNSTLLGVLFFPMNVLSRISYKEIWEKGDTATKVVFGIVVYTLWWFMLYILDVNERK